MGSWSNKTTVDILHAEFNNVKFFFCLFKRDAVKLREKPMKNMSKKNPDSIYKNVPQ